MNTMPNNCEICGSDDVLETHEGFGVCNNCGIMQLY